MRTSTGLIAVISLILATILIQNVNGAAVMSIDIGSEWMKVGIVSPGKPMEIALNKESKRKTPSVIAFREKTRFIGDEAITLAARFPASSYGYIIDLLGKTVDSPIVELYKKRFPYYDIQPDPVRNAVTFKNGEETYTVEELVAQLLQRAQEFAQDASEQAIQECVLTVPGFFGQAERTALLSAAKLANIKVLQLINDYTAVALNYGIFQQKHINETAQYVIFYDMGASKTAATVISYQLVKDKVLRETLPVVQVMGVGYDRTLGGLEMQLRLRDYLGNAFNDMKKTPKNVFENPRAMAKLLKEAGRVKNILSANVDHYAQIEGLLDEQDFKFKVTREKYEELCADLFDRAAAPVQKALDAAGLTIDVVSQFILFGGNSRTPKVQEILKSKINMELAKNLNADEAATMGAVYRAADLATGFKVKKFIVKDAVLFPIHVVFERESGNKKSVVRTLFGPMNTYPQKKVITFNKHKQDFDFNVNYADLDYLGANEISNIGSLNISKIQLTNVAQLFDEKIKEGVESKGIKAHFLLDDSGLFSLVNVELLLEKAADSADDKEEGTLSKLGSTISKLFGGDKEEGKVDAPKNETETEPEEATEKPQESNEATEAPPVNETANESAPKNETTTTDKPKVVIIKEQISAKTEELVMKTLNDEQFEESLKRMDEIYKLEQEKLRRENAVNSLETHVIEAQRRFQEKEYISCATQKELEEIKSLCSEISDWIYEDGIDAKVEVFEEKLESFTKKTNEVYARHWEHRERPEAVKALKGMIEGAQQFLASAKNITQDPEKKDVFNEKEIEDLAKGIQEVIDWRDKEVSAQNKMPKNEPVRLTVKQLTDKMAFLDREVKYLVNKIKRWRPKEKPKEKKVKNETTSSNATEQDETQQEVPQDEPKIEENEIKNEEPSQTIDESVPLEQNDEEAKVEPTETEDDKEEHTEL
jgi:hypoxia up-regulated 1